MKRLPEKPSLPILSSSLSAIIGISGDLKKSGGEPSVPSQPLSVWIITRNGHKVAVAMDTLQTFNCLLRYRVHIYV